MKLSGGSLRLLEDEPLLRRQLGAHLEKLGVAVTLVGTLAEARQTLRNLEFDFALLDVNLPDGRCLELLQEQGVPASVVSVVMTAEGGGGGGRWRGRWRARRVAWSISRCARMPARRATR